MGKVEAHMRLCVCLMATLEKYVFLSVESPSAKPESLKGSEHGKKQTPSHYDASWQLTH